MCCILPIAVRINCCCCSYFKWMMFLLDSVPHINEFEARGALLLLVSQHCCYGKTAAKDMTIRKIAPSSAYHVSRLYIITNIGFRTEK